MVFIAVALLLLSIGWLQFSEHLNTNINWKYMDIFTINSLPRSAINYALKKVMVVMSFCALWLSSYAIASGNFYSTGPQATFGAVTYQQGNYINVINPASAAFHRQSMDPDQVIMGSGSLGAGIEYGGVDELFERIDNLSENFKSSGDGSDSGGGDEDDGDQPPGIDIGDIVDLDDPELQSLIKTAKKKAVILGGTLALIMTEGYAHTYVDANLNFLVNKDIAGGTLAFNFQSSVSSSFIGISDNPDFNADTALSELKAAYNNELQVGDDTEYYDLSGGITLSVDPNTGKVRAQFQNDSVVVSKAAKMMEFGLTYSRSIANYESGQLFVGVKPKLNWIGLTQVAVRLGDLSDAEDLFKSNENLEFNYDGKFGLDLGMYWNANNYALGSTIVNTTEPTFHYPEVNTQNYKNPTIARRIDDESQFQLERQFKVEASLFTDDYQWFTGVSADINETQDPLHQRFQWITWSGGYQPPLWWFSNVRTGAKHNLAGSELTYLNLGVTVLKYVNLDISSTLLVTSINDMSLPRGVRADLGFNFAF